MSKATSRKSAAPAKSGSPLLTGILVGMVVGVAMAAGLAWFIMKSPNPFAAKEVANKPAVEVIKHDAEVRKPVTEAVKPKTEQTISASGVEEAKPRFEFYKVLTDKQDTTEKAPVITKPVTSKPATPSKQLFLQAGSFINEADAETLKATLAMKGIEANIQQVDIPEKGVMHRVRVGPFNTDKEMNAVRSTLKLNGLETTPIH